MLADSKGPLLMPRNTMQAMLKICSRLETTWSALHPRTDRERHTITLNL